MKGCQIKAAIGTICQDFCRAAPHGGRLLQAVSGKTVQKEKVLHVMMRADNGVVIKGIHRVMPGPFTLYTNGFELRDAMRQHRPYMIFPERLIHREIIKIDSRVMRGMSATLICATAAFAHMNARRIDCQRQIAVKWLFRPEQPAEPLARLDRHINASHCRGAGCARARGIDQLAA